MKILKKNLISILSIILLGSLIIIMSSFILNRIISKENINRFIQDINLNELVIDKNNEIDLKTKITNKYSYNHIDSNITQNILEILEIKEILTNLISEYIDYNLNKRTLPQISDEEIDKILLSENLDKVIGKKLNDKDKNDIKYIFKELQYEINEKLENDEFNNFKVDKYEVNFKKIGYLLSFQFLTLMIIITIISLCLYCICLWNLNKSVFRLGIISIISSFCLILIGMIISSIIKMFFYYKTTKNINSLIKTIIFEFVKGSIILFVFGIIMIIIYIFIRKKNKGKEKVLSKKRIGYNFCFNCGAIKNSENCIVCNKKDPKEIDKV